MLITRKDPLTGKENSLELPVTEQQLDQWRGGRLIQVVMRNLTKDQREFIMTGLMPESWNDIFEKTANVPKGDDLRCPEGECRICDDDRDYQETCKDA